MLLTCQGHFYGNYNLANEEISWNEACFNLNIDEIGNKNHFMRILFAYTWTKKYLSFYQ